MLRLFQKQAMIPAEHGSWVFLFSPLLIGLAAAGWIDLPVILVCLSALAGFMARQPLTLVIKVLSNRRPKKDLFPAIFWFLIYSMAAGICLGILLLWGYGFLLWLALPTSITLSWHLWLVSKRRERRNVPVEIAGSGVLALVAPAIYWVSGSQLRWEGGLLWGLCWLQATVSILYAFYRLDQKNLGERLTRSTNLRLAMGSITGSSLALLLVSWLASVQWVSPWLIIAFLIQWVEVFWGIIRPAVGWKPAQIGIRQLIVSSIFTIVFMFAW